ncbi:MAG TPA: methionyl-tRNA formyltransferase [Burkholderiaceae bacterium]|jgi:methionyl-tRNA formyltransferase|nr:methionyl-tRNA formyltransferase [Burkholderiaceae bacterium]
MRLAFAGTPRFAAVALAAILDAGHTVPLVLTQPDRPAGRGLKRRASAVSELASSRGLTLLSPRSLREGPDALEVLDRLRLAEPDLLLVAAYGLILPQAVLDIPRGIEGRSGVARAINIHASLLPRWRGAAPVARAIEAGDRVTGITLMQMDAGLDTGAIVCSEPAPIEAGDTTGTTTERLARLGARLVVSWLAEAPAGRWMAVPQPPEGVSYAHKISRREAWLDFREPAAVLARRVRAFDPEPGASGAVDGTIVKIWSAEAANEANADGPAGAAAGTVISACPDGIRVACGDGVLVIRELQRAGGRRLRAREFLQGTPLPAGTRWQVPAIPDRPN